MASPRVRSARSLRSRHGAAAAPCSSGSCARLRLVRAPFESSGQPSPSPTAPMCLGAAPSTPPKASLAQRLSPTETMEVPD
eukprot:scaffold80790_cov42-Phaeocystis_antarctica.AAC.1